MIYWLTGIIGAGKSTLGAALAASIPNACFADGDYLLGSDDDEMPFAERVERKHQNLLDLCSAATRPLVIAYPLDAGRAAKLRDQLAVGQLTIIGIVPPQGHGTRHYSDWERTRQQEMAECNGAGFADLLFTHPTFYLHDSLIALRAQLKI